MRNRAASAHRARGTSCVANRRAIIPVNAVMTHRKSRVALLELRCGGDSLIELARCKSR